jgi:hypothetical protein
VLLLLRDSPLPRPPRVPLGHALAVAAHDLREAWTEPGTRLAFWLGFMTLFAPMIFGVMWGYPFLVLGQGLSPELAGALISVLALSGLVYGVTIGTVIERYLYYRSRIGVGLVCLAGAIWADVSDRGIAAPAMKRRTERARGGHSQQRPGRRIAADSVPAGEPRHHNPSPL